VLEVVVEAGGAPEDAAELMRGVALAACRAEGVPEADACARIVNDHEMRRLNAASRGVDRATDVLSFPMVKYPSGTARDNARALARETDPETGRAYIGDIAISIDRARAQAAEYGHALERELGFLTAHAMLHLLGYDHERDADERAMRAMEENVLSQLNLSRDRDMSDDALFALAAEAMESAYAPYSGFKVGACVLAADGRTFAGCNVENASYGASICAERSAVVRAVSEGAREIVAIAVAAERTAAWPCGACRQVINEFASPDARLIVGRANGPCETVPFKEIFPRSFGPKDLTYRGEE